MSYAKSVAKSTIVFIIILVIILGVFFYFKIYTVGDNEQIGEQNSNYRQLSKSILVQIQGARSAVC